MRKRFAVGGARAAPTCTNPMLETVLITAFIILAGGIALTVLERSLFFRNGRGARLLLALSGGLLVAHGIGLLGIPPHVMGRMVWGDFVTALALFAATVFIPRRIGVARLLSFVGGIGMCVLHGLWFITHCGDGFVLLLQHPSLPLFAECGVFVIGTVTALTSFHLRSLDVDPYQTF